jgi:hypothetical protein
MIVSDAMEEKEVGSMLLLMAGEGHMSSTARRRMGKGDRGMSTEGMLQSSTLCAGAILDL